MPKRSARHTVLSDTATHDRKSGDLRAVIETPKGSRNKYRYDADCDCFELAATLRPHTLDDIKGFFVDYNRLHDKRFEIRGEHGPTRAAKLVKKGVAAYAKKAGD